MGSVVLVISWDRLEDALMLLLSVFVWITFHEFLPPLTNRGISLLNRGKVFKACARSMVLYGSEKWPMSTRGFSHNKTSDHSLIQWICGVKIKQQHSIEELRRRLDLQHIEDVLRWNRLRLSGHLYQQEEKSWAKKIMNFFVDAPTFWGRPKLR